MTVRISRLGLRIDGWADLIEGAGDKVVPAMQAIADTMRARNFPKVEIRYDRKNIHFKVSDNGVGIPEEEMPYIFSPYFRGEYGEANNIDGDGLGLWVARTYAAILGGEITAQNIYDSKNRRNGASFTLIIPREIKKKDKNEEKNEQYQ